MSEAAQWFRETPFAGALTTGLLLGAAFLFSAAGPLAWVALIPLLLRWSAQIAPAVAGYESYVAFLLAYLLSTHWAAFHPVAPAAAAGIAALFFVAVGPAVAFLLSARLSRRLPTELAIVGLVVFVAAYETFSAHHASLLPWFLLGYTQINVEPISRLAAFVGAGGVSLLVLTVNVLGLSAVLSAGSGGSLRPAALGVLMLSAALMPGLSGPSERIDPKQPVRITMVQPGVEAARWSSLSAPERLAVLLPLSRLSETNTDLLVWPESSLHLKDSLALASIPSTLALRAPVILGATRPARDLDEHLNSAVAIDGSRLTIYDKRYLIPFVEHVPTWLSPPGNANLIIPSGGVSSYEAGDADGVMPLRGLTIGVMICFESLFPHYARRLVKADVDVIAVLAQDGWWSSRVAARQHLDRSRMRAIETGRPLVQATVDGITAAVDHTGLIVARAEPRVAARLDTSVRPTRARTPFVEYGLWFDYLIWFAAACFAPFLFGSKETRPGRPTSVGGR